MNVMLIQKFKFNYIKYKKTTKLKSFFFFSVKIKPKLEFKNSEQIFEYLKFLSFKIFKNEIIRKRDHLLLFS